MARVMIVDDEPTTAASLKLLLELDGFDVVVAASGDVAMKIAGEQSPDAFLVDYHLADYEGTTFIRQLRKKAEFQQAPVILTSGLNREDEAKESGANHFLIKPFNPEELVSILTKYLGDGGEKKDK